MSKSRKLDKIDQAAKEKRLVQYRVMGYSDAQIMVMEEYGSVQAANRAVNNAIRKLPPENINPDPEAVRIETDATNAYLREKLIPIITNPPPVHSAIGKLVPDPDTCTCDHRLAASMAEHDPDCKVKPVRDESARIRAISEYRKLGDQRTHLHGATRKEIREDIAMQDMRAWFREFERAYDRVSDLGVMPAVPVRLPLALDQGDAADTP